MFAKLVALFTIIPAIELALLTLMGIYVGFWPTLALIVVTAFGGAYLGKAQGMSAWKRINEELATGALPEDSILDGLAVLIASALLLTPGVLTDFVGFGLLIPATRKPIKAFAKTRLKRWMAKQDSPVSTYYSFSSAAFGGEDDPFQVVDPVYFDTSASEPSSGGVIDVTPHKEERGAGW